MNKSETVDKMKSVDLSEKNQTTRITKKLFIIEIENNALETMNYQQL